MKKFQSKIRTEHRGKWEHFNNIRSKYQLAIEKYISVRVTIKINKSTRIKNP